MNQPNQNQLPSPDQAFNYLSSEVHARAFFSKLASFGIAPANDTEAADLLKLAGTLRTVAEDPAVKKAAAESRFASAVTDLDTALTQNNLANPIKQAAAQEQELAIANLARQLTSDPNVFNSVLSLKAAEAAYLAQNQAATTA